MKHINQLLPSTSSVKANISVEVKTSTERSEQEQPPSKVKYRVLTNIIDDEEPNMGNAWKFEYISNPIKK